MLWIPKQNKVYMEIKKSYNFIESYFSRKVFYRNKIVFAMCLQLISQITNLGLKKKINTVMNIKYELLVCTTPYLTPL